MTENQKKFDTCEKVIMHAKRVTHLAGAGIDIPITCEEEVKPMVLPENPSKMDLCYELIRWAKIVDKATKKRGDPDIPFVCDGAALYKAERASVRISRMKERRRKNAENFEMDVDSR